MKKIRSLALAGLFVLSAARGGAVTLTENFTNEPAQNGWQIFGDTNLFHWDSTNQNLDVTWDSSQVNSYFYKPLGTTLSVADAFTVDFDIQLSDISWGGGYPPQIAVGLFNLANAEDPNFSRPIGTSPNLFEFDYFPFDGNTNSDGNPEPNIAATITDSTTADTDYPDFYFIWDVLPMETNVTYHVTLTHAAGDQAISATVLTNGQIYTTMPFVNPAPIVDLQLDTLSISSYSEGSDTNDFILAHGTVDNFVVTLPPVVRNLTGAFSNSLWQVQFGTYTNWLYTLERSTNLVSWSAASASANGNGDVMTLSDINAPAGQAFYRVRAEQP